MNSTPTCLYHTTAIPLLYHRISQVAYVCFILPYRDERQNCKENELKYTFYPLSLCAMSSQRSPSSTPCIRTFPAIQSCCAFIISSILDFGVALTNWRSYTSPHILSSSLSVLVSSIHYRDFDFDFDTRRLTRFKSHRIIQIAKSPISTLSNESMT